MFAQKIIWLVEDVSQMGSLFFEAGEVNGGHRIFAVIARRAFNADAKQSQYHVEIASGKEHERPRNDGAWV